MCCKAEFLDTAPSRYHCPLRLAVGSGPSSHYWPTPVAHDSRYAIRLIHQLLGHCTFDAVPSNDHPILLTGGPSLQQFSTHSVLKHARTGKHDAFTHIVESLQVLETSDETEVPRSSFPNVTGLLCLCHTLTENILDIVVHGADVSLVDNHAFSGQVRGIVYLDPLILRMPCPVFIQNQ